MYHLMPEERDRILLTLTDNQRQYLSEEMSRGKRTAFARVMAEAKGADIPEDATLQEIECHLSEWVLDQYVDAGYVSPDHRCECGRPLRHQYLVIQKSTGEIRSFGITHLEEHTGIDAAIVALIKKGFDAIDYELDQILAKVRSGWVHDREFLGLPADVALPADIARHLSLKLPLHDRFHHRLKVLKQEYDRENMGRQQAMRAAFLAEAAEERKRDKFAALKEQLERYKASPKRRLYPGLEDNLARCDAFIRRIEAGDPEAGDCLDRLASLIMSLSYSPLGR